MIDEQIFKSPLDQQLRDALRERAEHLLDIEQLRESRIVRVHEVKYD